MAYTVSSRSNRPMARPTRGTINVVWARDLSRCFRCAIMLHYGQGGYSIHHRQPRGMGGSRDPAINDPANLLLLCGSGVTGCHGWVESNRPEATDLGLLVSRNSRYSPIEVPVQRWGGQMVRLDADGGIEIVG